MAVKEYLKEAFRLTSLIFTTLVFINFFLQNEAQTKLLGYMLLMSAISGSLHFLLNDNGSYSDKRLLFNQLLYLAIVCLQITLANYLMHWRLGVADLLMNYAIVLVIYIFIRYIMYSNDRKQAQEINTFIQKRKRDKS